MDMMNTSLDDDDTSHPAPAVITAPATQPAGLPWIVPGLIGQGLSILAGPRTGKSLLALDLAVAVATGRHALQSIAALEGNVLYIDLENGRDRIEARLQALFSGLRPDLSRLEFCHQEPDAEPVDALEAWRIDVPHPRLVVIDAAQQVGPVDRGPWSRRAPRAEELEVLQRWAVVRGVAVLVVTRTDAGRSATFDAADAALVLDRKAGEVVLSVHSRDAARRKLTLRFDDGRWSIVDPGDASSLSRHRSDIMAVLKSSAWAMSPRRVARELGIPVANARKTMSRMARDGQIARWSQGEYILPTWTAPLL